MEIATTQADLTRRGVRGRRFSLDETVRFAGVVCDVLEVMHEMGVVHRDLKPDNIVFSQRGKSENIKILDFGIAKLATSSVSDHLTQTGSIVGTPSYMSPEQCLAGQIDGRSDIYALGVILFQMVTGRLPFDSDNLLTMMYLHVNREPPSAHDIDPSVPPAVSDVIQQMMAKTPADRFQSAASCAAALSGAAGVIIPIREGMETSAALAISGAFPARMSSGAQVTVARPILHSAEIEASSSSKMGRGPLAGYLAVGTLALAASAAGLWYAPSLWTSPGTNAVENSGGATNGPLGVSSVLAEHFVEIAGGTVTIGANENDCGDMDFCRIGPEETPPHTVSLSPFWIAKREVTNIEYAEFVSATGYGAPSNWRGTYPRGTDALPVTNVSWFDAIAYTAWRSERDGIAYRLPTEQEWEYAARGDDARMFPWGDFWNANSVNSDQKSDKGSPLPVDQTPNNTTDVTPRGVGALAGNVCEWTSTQFEAYPGSPYKPTQGDLACKVIRGGSFNTKPNASRTTYRAWQPAEKSARDIGFRLAADASSSADGAK